MPTFSRVAAGDDTTARSTRTRIALLFALGALLAIGVISVVQASLPADTTFRLDGYYYGTANASGSGTDWYNASNVAVFTDGTTSAEGDDIFWTGGSKDVRPIGDWRWKMDPTPSQKTDLRNVLIRTESVGGSLIAYFAARRTSSVGNAKVGFWILQNAVGPIPGGTFSGQHEIGDVLVDVDWTTGAIQTNGIKAYRWDGNGFNGPRRLTSQELTSGTFGDCKTVNRGNVNLCATVNSVQIASPWGNLPAGTFIEGAVNLTALFGISSIGCGPTILAETRSSGSSVMSELEDFVGASLANCALTIRKVAPEENTSFTFTTTGLTPSTFDLTSGGRRTFTLRDDSTATVTESAKAGWSLTGLACTKVSGTAGATVATSGDTVTVDIPDGENGVFDCTYTNHKTPSIEVIKHLHTDDTTAQFGLSIDATQYTSTATDGTSTGVQYVTAGAHTVSETETAGVYDISAYTTTIACSKPGSANFTTGTFTGTDTRSLAVTVAWGDRVTCDITNTIEPTLTVIKSSMGRDGTTFSFAMTGTDATTFSLTTHSTVGSPDSSSKTFALSSTTGTWTVTEDMLAGWMLTDVSCDVTTGSGSGTYALSTSTGDRNLTITDIGYRHVTCTFVNNGVGATRTQGFWSTHPEILTAVWGGTDGDVVGGRTIAWSTGDRTMCWADVGDTTTNTDLPGGQTGFTGDDLSPTEVMGGFWSRISFYANGSKREALGQARMRLAQQLLAAILNHATFGSSPSGPVTIAQAKTQFCIGTSVTAIDAAQTAMDNFNRSGDSGVFTPGGSAKPQQAIRDASYTIWGYVIR